MTRTWAIEDHLCRKCGGRILRCETGCGMTPGGRTLYKCADCGIMRSGMLPDVLCWCGMTHGKQIETPYMCIALEKIKNFSELKKRFCNGEVAVVLVEDAMRIMTRK